MERIINRVLAAVLVASIFVIGGATLALHGRELAYAAFVSHTQYLRPGTGVTGDINARTQSLTNAININLFTKKTFERFNARFQLALGKQALSYGSQTMVRLSTGQLYDVQADADVTEDVGKMAELYAALSERGIPMLFVYLHSELYEDGLLPGGVDDFNNKVADDIVNGLRAAGIPTIDSREVYREYERTLDDAAYRTDNHIAMPLNFDIYREVLKNIETLAGIAGDPAVSDPANFDFTTYPGSHMAAVGARVGAEYVAPDDYVLVTPRFDTFIHERIEAGADYAEREGTYQDAVMDLGILSQLERADYTNMYDITGDHRSEAYRENPTGAEGRVLVVKDSFGTPVASMLSLAVRDELAIDLRKTQRPALDYVDSYAPDVVVILHCQEMMRGSRNYVFVNQKNPENVD